MSSFLKFLIFIFCIWQVSAGLDCVPFNGTDEILVRNSVPSHLLPSSREMVNQRVYNRKIFGRKDSIPHESVPTYPGIAVYPQDYGTSLLQHLFPRDEPFLLANQVEVDPVSKLSSDTLGKLIRATEIPDLEERLKVIAEILEVNFQAPSIKDVDSGVFSRQDRVVGHRRVLETTLKEEDYKEIFPFDPSQPMTSYMRYKNLRIFDKGLLVSGELEGLSALPYKDNAIRLLRKRRFAEVLSKAATEDLQETQEGLAAFFWRRATSIDDMKSFYQSYTGRPLDLPVSVFPFEAFDRLTAQVTATPESYFSLSPEERFFLISRTRLLHFYPIGYATAKFRDVSFPDCVETAIWNVYLQITFRVQDNQPIFDASLLPEGPAKSYFMTHSTWEDILSSQGRNDWAEILSNQTDYGLTYYKTKKGFSCELVSRLRNVVEAFRYLSGLPPEKAAKAVSLEQVDTDMSLVSQALSAKRPTLLRLDRDSKIGSGTGTFDLYFDERPEEDFYVGNLKVETTHGRYEIPSSKQAPWIGSVLKVTSTPEQTLMTTPLIIAPDHAIDARGDGADGYTFSRNFKEPDFLTPILKLARTLSPLERLQFYKTLNVKDVLLKGMITQFVIENDSDNFPYVLGVLGNANFAIDDYERISLRMMVCRLVLDEKLTSAQILQITDAFPKIYVPLPCTNNFFNWVIKNRNPEILGAVQEKVTEITVDGELKDFEAMDSYLKQFPYLTDFKCGFGSIADMQFMARSLPRTVQRIFLSFQLEAEETYIDFLRQHQPTELDTFMKTKEKTFEDFLKGLEILLEQNPQRSITSLYTIMQPEILRKTLSYLVKRRLPHRKFKAHVQTRFTGDDEILREDQWVKDKELTETIYEEADQAGIKESKGYES